MSNDKQVQLNKKNPQENINNLEIKNEMTSDEKINYWLNNLN